MAISKTETKKTQEKKEVKKEVGTTKEVEDKTENIGITNVIKEKIEEKSNSKSSIRKIEREEWIPVMNNIIGRLIFQHPTCRTELDMENYGDVDYIQYGDLMTMKTSQGKILKEGWLLILDEDVYVSLGLESLYNRIITIEDVKKIYELPVGRIKEILTKAPTVVKENVCRKVLELKNNGTWDSISKLKAIEEVTGISFKTVENKAISK